MRPKRIGAVVNPVSGDGRGEELFAELANIFDDVSNDMTVESTVSDGPEDVARAAREHANRRVDAVAVVGGDGTLREVASALYEYGQDGPEPPPLFIVPAGRGNSTYRHLYGDADWRVVARELAHEATTEPLDLGCVENEPAGLQRYFLLGFTVGLFRQALKAAEAFHGLPGPLAYLLGTGLAVVTTDPIEVSVTRGADANGPGRADGPGEELFTGAAWLVAVGGGCYRGSSFELFPGSDPGDSTLHLLVVKPTSARGALRIGQLARRGEHVSHPAVNYFRGEAFDLWASGGSSAEVDGTPLEDDIQEAHLLVLPGALSFVTSSPP